MRKNHQKVIQAWIAGKHALVAGQRMDGLGIVTRLRTDGKTIFSYAMPLARFSKGGKDRARIELVERGRCPSATTRAQWDAIRYVCRYEKHIEITYVQKIEER